jgi:hypothetical protein
VLAYVFWHSPSEDDEVGEYEAALEGFHRSLCHRRPVGMLSSAAYRVAESPPGGAAGYEDWYLLEDYGALGVLNEAAVGRGHETAHDRIARRFGAGAGGLYGLREGKRHAGLLENTPVAVWVTRPPGAESRGLGELLGDGIDPASASLWRRQLVLGPAGEFCVLAAEVPSGVAATRLPAGWGARASTREQLWYG